MIINHTLRFIFLHVPKTAGTSVTNWLSEYTGWNDIELGGTRYGEQIQEVYGLRFKLNKHSPARQVAAVVGDEIWRHYYKFAIVRHPLDRLVSAFQFYQEWDHPGVAPAKECRNLSEFLNSSYFAKDHLNCTRATGLQSTFLATGDVSPLDRICKFENLGDEIKAVASQLGIEAPSLPHINSSQRRGHEEYLNDEVRALAEAIYAEDFDRFGYSR